MSLAERPCVAVIGGGFSGLMTALHLVEAPDGPRVHLIERGPDVGRGVAYARGGEDYRLNVRARNMSAWPARPDDFARWVADAGEDAPDGFASRAAYGAYLQALLHRCAGADRLVIHRDEAVDLAPAPNGWAVSLAGGERLETGAAVLAIGNLAPSTPRGVEADALASPAYVADPWAADLAGLPAEGCAVLLGTGLTMIDVALRLSRVRPQLKLLAISRRGLLPRRHLAPPPPESDWVPPQAASPRALLRQVRARAAGENWRAAVDALRPHAQRLWRGWSAAERGRFLRHLRPWWDVHRHRLAPEVAARLDRRVESGGLTHAAGRLVRVAADADALQVTWRPRDAQADRTLRAAALVNCTGPNADVARAGEPLLQRLVARGLVRSDALRLGFDVDRDGRLRSTDGRADPRLFAVGPMTRGAAWEITSVPDIRAQAAACAQAVQSALALELALSNATHRGRAPAAVMQRPRGMRPAR